MKILGIETSCDETAVAVVEAPRRVLSSAVFSQIDLHGPYGGVVPEIACRSHVEALPGVLESALEQAGLEWGDIDEVAVTYGPGLASSLLVGLASAKSLALRLDVPVRYVNHLHGHIFSSFLTESAPLPEDVFPFLSLVVSGGHSCLVRVAGYGQYELLGQTIDDAAGEAFDKGANLLGLGYPGGPVMDRIGKQGDPKFYRFPRGRARRERGLIGGLDSDLCFSFSGLKTALLYYLRDNPPAEGDEQLQADIVASYQEAIVDALVRGVERGMGEMETLVVGGGVSLNSRLRYKLTEFAEKRGVRLLLTEARYCGDNAAMIALVSGLGLGHLGGALSGYDAEPSLRVTDS
jgi:N6-L-threonylcarbamoyladenine synthase